MHIASTIQLQSRLPEVGTTIFTVMSALANEHHAVNLGQGFPDFAGDPLLPEAVHQAMVHGHNQYPPMAGVLKLREAIASKTQQLYGHAYDPGNEVTVTAGATQALLTAVLALTQAGDDVMLLEPCYDSYLPSIQMAGCQAVRVPLNPLTFRPDFDLIKASITPRTRLLIINTPHNPSGICWSAQEMNELAEILRDTGIVLLSDEVYEHMVYDGQVHQSVVRHPELRERSLVVSSFGKTFHVTGWKVGYVLGPSALMGEFRKVHQFNVFTVNTPMQMGLSQYLQDPTPYLQLPDFYAQKRDHFREGLRALPFELLPCEGTYFQCVRYKSLEWPNAPRHDAEFCTWLTREIGVAAIPMSAFYAQPIESQVIRFCFAKKQETMNDALVRLQRYSAQM